MMHNVIRFETHIKRLSETAQDCQDKLRVTVKTINPDQTGLMTHSEIEQKDLHIFWLGVNAVARTWVKTPTGLILPAIQD